MINKKIALKGLGYVGLPHAVEFGKKRNVIGFDIDQSRINDLKCIFLPRDSDFRL
jgi:UDP-N-acetyl-D-glucosamine/UDP-N-acetyl-D-galactosamine dehydrogenase